MTSLICRIKGGVRAAMIAAATVAALCASSHAQSREPARTPVGTGAQSAGGGGVLRSQMCEPEWTPMGTGTQSGGVNAVRSMTVFDDGSGPALYIGGQFTSVNGVAATNIARWNGTTWSAVGGGVNGTVFTMAVFDDGLGGGPTLYAAGSFAQAGGAPASRIAKWNGTTWTALGSGMNGTAVMAMHVFDDGDGPDLYVGGNFTTANGVSCYKIARWDGVNFSPLAGGIGPPAPAAPIVNALASFDDGSGNALYAAGAFPSANGAEIPALRIARWDGAAWSSVLGGLDGPANALAVHNDGSGLAIYVGGAFTGAGLESTPRIARWDGEAWSSVGDGMDNGAVSALTVFDDGSGGGPLLYASGSFTSSDSEPLNGIAVWNGATWSSLASGFDGGPVLALAGFGGETPVLYAGGEFTSAGGASASRIARLLCNPLGACCLPSGMCEPRTQMRCERAGATYSGDGDDCGEIGPCTPAPVGACCLPSGCVVLWQNGEGGCVEQNGLYLGDGSACQVETCENYRFETEGNSSQATANPFTLVDGNTLVGLSTETGGSEIGGSDYFLIQTTPAPLGIYLHRMTLSTVGPVGHTTRIAGGNQTPVPAGVWSVCGAVGSLAAGSDGVAQAHILDGSDRINYWYGFGKEERIYYVVSGTAATTGVYTSTFDTVEEVIPTDIGNFDPGTITISTVGQGHTSDTHLMILDENLVAISGFGNDGASTNGGAGANNNVPSFLRRDYPAGTYYMAIGITNLASTVGKACDDNRRAGTMLEFPDAVVCGDATAATDVSFAVTDASGTTQFPASRPDGRGQIAWFRFTVGDAPCSADFDGNGEVQVPDIFAFLSAWFAMDPSADFDGNETINVPDIFAFLSAWFAGCP